MKIQNKSRNEERIILTGMIVDKHVIGRLLGKWTGDMFKNRWANLIGGWCVKHYQRYQEAPLNRIEDLFRAWADKQEDKKTVQMIEKFLSSLSHEYEEEKQDINTDYVLDVAGKYFNQVQLERLTDEVQDDIADGHADRGQEKVMQYTQVELGVGAGVNVLQDKEAINQAFDDERIQIVKYPGDLGKFFGQALERDGLIAFLGPEKRGKTFWLMDVAYMAMLQRRKVAFFEAGDMSQNQMMRRLMTRIAGRPIRPTTVKIPIKMRKRRSEKTAEVKTERRRFDTPLSQSKAKKACARIMRTKIRSKKPYFKLSCHPTSTLNMATIKSTLQEWERDGWVPDVIIIDYADIMDMREPGMEGRDQINHLWKQLRGLSQERHCLVVTATQADTDSYTVNTIGMKNFTDDKRKFAHVTGMIGINQNSAEKGKGVMRLNWIVLRENEFNTNKCVHVAGCLSLARPAMISCFTGDY